VALSRRSGGRSRLTLALLILTSLAILTLDFRDAGPVRTVRDAAGAVFSPLKGVGETVSEPVSNAWHGITDYGDVKHQNEQLKKQLAERTGDAVIGEDARAQLDELTQQLSLDWIDSIDTVPARVLAGSPSNFALTIDISKGKADGVKVGMPVVNGAGLVGKVIQANDHRSTVQLVTDPDFKVGVKLLPKGPFGTATGAGRGKDLIVDTAIEADSKAIPKKGTKLTTSGIDRSAFPASIPLGVIDKTTPAPDGLTVDLVVNPYADLGDLSFVTVLLWEGAAP
jgi:rod shape-determining protein MreC